MSVGSCQSSATVLLQLEARKSTTRKQLIELDLKALYNLTLHQHLWHLNFNVFKDPDVY